MLLKKIAIIKTATILLLINFIAVTYAAAIPLADKNSDFKHLNDFHGFWGKKITLIPRTVSKSELPTPYDFLLTQPLMTIGVEKYYQRTPKIQTVYALRNKKSNIYSRAIIMLIDSNKSRNDVKIAQAKRDEVVVELALITMNFKTLPENIITAVLNTNIPFGKLLATNKVKTFHVDRHYFSVKCDSVLSKYIRCNRDSRVYGRTNTIVRKNDGRWLAHVVEILSGSRCKEESCQNLTKGSNLTSI